MDTSRNICCCTMAIAGSCAALALFSSMARAEDAMQPIRWSDIAALIDRHPRLSAGKHLVDAARGGVDGAGAVPNPTLEGTVGRGVARAGDASRLEWGLALSVPLGWIAQRSSKVAAAEAGVELAVAEVRALRRDVLLQLRTLYWNTAYEQASVASLEALVAQTATLVDSVKRRVEKGEARPVEATRVEIELEKAAGELETARASLASRQAQLALWLGAPRGRAISVAADLGAVPAAMDLDAALEKARAPHPALLAARARTRSLAAELDAERRARVPSVSATASMNSELDRVAYGAGLAIDLPLWNWNSGRIAQGEAGLAAGSRQAEAEALELESTVIEAQAACRASAATATRLGTNVVPRSEAAARTMEKTYQLGEASLLEVIDARRTLLESRRLYLGALVQAQIDCSRFGALVGEELQ